MPQVALKSPDRLEILRCARISVRDAGVSRDRSRYPVGRRNRSGKPGRLRNLNPHDAGPRAGRGGDRSQPQVSRVAVRAKPEQRTTLTRAERRNEPVMLRIEQCPVMGLHVSHNRQIPAAHEVQRSIDDGEVTSRAEVFRQDAFRLPHPYLQFFKWRVGMIVSYRRHHPRPAAADRWQRTRQARTPDNHPTDPAFTKGSAGAVGDHSAASMPARDASARSATGIFLPQRRLSAPDAVNERDRAVPGCRGHSVVRRQVRAVFHEFCRRGTRVILSDHIG